MRLTKFEDSFHERLRDPDYAQSYLQAALNDGGRGEWLIALREAATASEGGLKHIAEQTGVGRESIYKSLSQKGNPRWETVRNVLDTLGFELIIQKKEESVTAARSRTGRVVDARGAASLTGSPQSRSTPKSGAVSRAKRSK